MQVSRSSPRGWRLFGASVLSMAALVLASGGLPLALGLLALLLVALVIHAPLIGLALAIPTQVIWVLGNIGPGGGAITLSKVFMALTVLGWLVWALRARVRLTYAPHMLPLGGFLLVVLLGPFITPAWQDAIVGIGKYALMLLPYFLVANLTTSRRAVLVVCLAISVTASLSAGLALTERFLPAIELKFDGAPGLGAHLDDESLGRGLSIARVTGGLGDANWFSYTMASCLPLALYWFRAYPQRRLVRVLAVAMAGLLFAGIVFSYTRTPFFGIAAAIALLVWKRRLPIRPLLLAGALALVTLPLWAPTGFIDRFFSQKYAKEGSTPMRTEVYDMAFKLIGERPLLGFGYQRFGPEFLKRTTSDMGWEFERRDREGIEAAELLRAHNIYLDITVLHGLLGSLLLVWFFIALLTELNHVAGAGPPMEAELAVAMMACLLSFFVCGMGGHAQELKILWILAGFAAGLRRVAFTGPAAGNR